MAGPVDEPGQQRPGETLQRRLPGVRGAELERRDSEPVAALLGQVDDEALAARTASRWYVVDRGRSRSRAIVAAGTGPGCAARWRRTPSACSAAGTWLAIARSSRPVSPGVPFWSRCGRAGTTTVGGAARGLGSQTGSHARPSSLTGCGCAMGHVSTQGTESIQVAETSRPSNDVVTVGVGPVAPADVVAVARHGAPIRLGDER